MTREEKLLAIKRKLKKTATEKFPGDEERQNRYVYKTLNTIKERMHG